MADFRIGENLNATADGRYYTIENGKYGPGNKLNGRYKNFVQSSTDGLNSRVNAIYDAQQKSQLDALKAQQTKAVAGYNQQKKDLVPQYQQQRGAADVVSQQNVQRLRELMAANGLNASGENVTAQANAGSARQASLNNINTQQNQATAAIDRQIFDVNDPTRQQGIINSVQAERSKALYDAQLQGMQQTDKLRTDWIGQERYNDDKAWREHTFNNMSASDRAQLEWAKTQYGEDAAWRMYDQQYQGNLQSSMNQAQLDAYGGFNGGQGGGDYSKYKISSGYGMRKDPFTGRSTMHNGIDIAMPKGAPVGATAGGTVIYAGFGQKGSGYGGYGNVVVVRDGNGNIHQYSHLDSIGVKIGQKVGSGALVGKAGSTGRSTGSHLDYMVRNSKGAYINPTGYITSSRSQPTNSGPGNYQSHVQSAVKMGLPAEWVPLLSEIVKKESSFNPNAKNPKSTAYGYGQFLKGTRDQYEKKSGLDYDNPVHQLVMMGQYVRDRYGSPAKAFAHWNKNKWY